MRQDLKHWPQALALAQQLAPERVPVISKEHASMLELVGEFELARAHYQQVTPTPAVTHTPPTRGGWHQPMRGSINRSMRLVSKSSSAQPVKA